MSIAARPVLGKGWRRLDADTVGEFDLLQLLTLASADATAREAAAGWGGGRFELWRRGPAYRRLRGPLPRTPRARRGDALGQPG